MKLVWIVLFAALIALESMTVNLVSIWFAIGAAAGLLANVLGFGFLGQMTAFVFVSAIALVLTRPLVQKFTDVSATRTNADRVLGRVGKVTEEVDDENGAVYVDGKTWSARNFNGLTIPVDTRVYIERIEGVKLIVSPAREETRV